MSGPEDQSPHRLVRELADTPGAIPVLVTLQESGGSATRDTLMRACGRRRVDDAVRWLAAVGLVRRTDGAGTFDLDQLGGVYALTGIGASLTRSLTELASICSNPVRSRGGAAIVDE
jgi:hypothetical protein